MSIYPRGYIMPILMDMRLHVIVVLIYISLAISDIEHLFMCLGHLTAFFGVFKSFAHFWIGLFVSLALSFRNSLYILDINFLSSVWLSNILSHSVGWLFILLKVLYCKKFKKTLMKSCLSSYFFCCLCLWCHVQEIIITLWVIFETQKYKFYMHVSC